MREKTARNVNNKVVRAENRKKLLRIISDFEPTSINNLVEKSGLSYPTVFTIVKQLESEGIIEKQGFAPTTGGRQAVRYSIYANNSYTIGIHIYYDWISVTITNICDGIVYESVDRRNTLACSQETVIEQIVQKIQRASTDTNIPFSKVSSICLCIPRMDNLQFAFSVSIRSRPEWEIDEIASAVSSVFGVKVTVIPDTTVLNYIERSHYALTSFKNYIYVVLELELEIAIYGGKIDQEGYMESKGLFGHTTVIPDGASCSCGNNGCLSTYCNGIGMYEYFCSLKQKRNEVVPPFEQMLFQGMFHSMLHLCHQKDPCALETMDRTLQLLGIAIANLIKTLGMYTVVLSGFFTSNELVFYRKLQKYVHQNIPDKSPHEAHLIVGTALPENCSFGACLMQNEKFFENLDLHIRQKDREILPLSASRLT